jgi:hypothetical protein
MSRQRSDPSEVRGRSLGPLFDEQPKPEPDRHKEAEAMKTTPCKGCGKPIVYIEILKKDGTPGLVPLDPRPPVYAVTIDDQDGQPVSGVRLPRAFVSHFATCPKAGQFSGAKRKAKP